MWKFGAENHGPWGFGPQEPQLGPFPYKKKSTYFSPPKSDFRYFCKVFLELFRECLGIVFGSKSITFFSSKGSYIIPKIDILVTFGFQEDHSDNFGYHKSRFLDFFKVTFQLYKECLGVDFGSVFLLVVFLALRDGCKINGAHILSSEDIVHFAPPPPPIVLKKVKTEHYFLTIFNQLYTK